MMFPKGVLLDLCGMMGMDEKEIKAVVDEVYRPSSLKDDPVAQKVLGYLKEHGLSVIVHPSRIRRAARRLGISPMEFVDVVVLLEDCGLLEQTFIKADSHIVSKDKTISQNESKKGA